MRYTGRDRWGMPKHYWEYLEIASNAGLSNPSGRALYACNRRQNGWPRTNMGLECENELVVLSRVRPETAKRWLAHWKKEGHVKSLRPHAAELLAKRLRDARIRKIREANRGND